MFHFGTTLFSPFADECMEAGVTVAAGFPLLAWIVSLALG